MRVLRVIGICILCLLVMAASFLSLSSALLRFLVCNPAYLKTFVPSSSYCMEIREQMKENLDYITLLYGIEAEVLSEIVTNTEIEACYAASVDSLFREEKSNTSELSYPAGHFQAYLSDHTAYSSQAISDFSEDCAASVAADLYSLSNPVLASVISDLLHSRLVRLSPFLCLTAVVLIIVLIAMIRAVCEEKPVIGRITIAGGLFTGFSGVFVPLIMFWLFDYISRLNLPISSFRTALVASVNTILYGCLSVSGILVMICFLALFLSCFHAARAKPRRQTRH